MKKAINLVLLAALLSTLFACGGPSDSDVPVKTDVSESDAPAETDLFDGLSVTSYTGRKFKWMIPDMDVYQGDLWSEGETGEVYNDAIYRRNQLVQERFGITVDPVIELYSWDLRNEYTGKIRSSVQADDDAYDLVACQSFVMSPLALDDILLDLNTVKAFRFDRPWWSGLVYDALTFRDKVYFMSGDISVNILEFANVLFMNKDLAATYKLEIPYTLVREGKWTQDKLEAMIKGTSSDANGDGTMDGNDKWGYIFHDAATLYNLPVSFGITLSRRDGDKIVFNLDSEDALFGAEYNRKFFAENPDTHYATKATGGSGLTVFKESRAIFYAHQLNRVDSLRDMEADFAVIPFPKLNEDQEKYITSVRDSFMTYSVPASHDDPEFAGTITEALCVSGSEYVIPAYYDVLLKGKTVRDSDSAEMLDVIKGSLSVDFAYAYAYVLDNIHNVYKDLYQNNQELPSYWAGKRSALEKKLADLLAELS